MRQEQDLTCVKLQQARHGLSPALWVKAFGAGALALALISASCLTAFAQTTPTKPMDWVKGEKSRVRLISEGGLFAGAYQLGIEIELEGQALTYWRYPGEAGIPPNFDFTRSRNLAKSEVFFPSPRRIMEAGVEALGYQRRVIFPVKITPSLATQPVSIDLTLSYAICENICIPGQAHLQTELSPRMATPAQTGPVTMALQTIPIPAESKEFVKLTPLPAQNSKPLWRIELKEKGDHVEDLFAEGPEGWYFDTKRESDEAFILSLAEKPANGGFPLKNVVLTLVRSDQAFEMRLELSLAP